VTFTLSFWRDSELEESGEPDWARALTASIPPPINDAIANVATAVLFRLRLFRIAVFSPSCDQLLGVTVVDSL
jgi:hypothetical protein